MAKPTAATTDSKTRMAIIGTSVRDAGNEVALHFDLTRGTGPHWAIAMATSSSPAFQVEWARLFGTSTYTRGHKTAGLAWTRAKGGQTRAGRTGLERAALPRWQAEYSTSPCAGFGASGTNSSTVVRRSGSSTSEPRSNGSDETGRHQNNADNSRGQDEHGFGHSLDR